MVIPPKQKSVDPKNNVQKNSKVQPMLNDAKEDKVCRQRQEESAFDPPVQSQSKETQVRVKERTHQIKKTAPVKAKIKESAPLSQEEDLGVHSKEISNP